MKKPIAFIAIVLLSSCIPYKIAPKFKNEDYKVMKAKKFHKTLAKETSFIFKDPKDANEFYNYINTKYKLNHNDVGLNTPIQIKGTTYYFTYHEVERTDESLVLPLVVTDLKRSSNGNDPLFEDHHTTRKGHWYIVATVYDDNLKNCLLDKHPMKTEVLQYLKELQQEYLRTHNYEELLFTKKS